MQYPLINLEKDIKDKKDKDVLNRFRIKTPINHLTDIKRYDNCDIDNVDVKYIYEITKKNIFAIPESQREKEWLPEQNEKFILSLLQNKPTGNIILNKKNNKKYILDGQHRINSIELFCDNKFGLNINNNKYNYSDFDDEYQKILLDTKMLIIEYNNLSDQEMKDIIESINEGIKNDCVFNKNNTFQTILDNYNNLITNIIYKKNYNQIKQIQKDEQRKIIGMIGTIIDNFSDYKSNSDYRQLNSKHVDRYINKLNDENKIKNIYEFIQKIYDDELLNHNDIIIILEIYEYNNYILNCILYKLYEYINKDNFSKNIHKNIIIKLLQNYHKNKFRDLLDIYDNLYDNLYNKKEKEKEEEK